MRIFIGMETSGELRRRFAARGHDVISCDILPAQDAEAGAGSGQHITGDVFETLEWLRLNGWTPDAAIFHPTCTFHTNSAAWAFNEPDFDRYPGVGYHQKLKAGTLTGQARRAARDEAVRDVKRIDALDIPIRIIENPTGSLSTMFRKPSKVIQPYQFGDDASKATCLWLVGCGPIIVDESRRKAGRMVEWPRNSGKIVERWANQTDSGQSNVTPADDRWKHRSNTYPGIADEIVRLIETA